MVRVRQEVQPNRYQKTPAARPWSGPERAQVSPESPQQRGCHEAISGRRCRRHRRKQERASPGGSSTDSTGRSSWSAEVTPSGTPSMPRSPCPRYPECTAEARTTSRPSGRAVWSLPILEASTPLTPTPRSHRRAAHPHCRDAANVDDLMRGTLTRPP